MVLLAPPMLQEAAPIAAPPQWQGDPEAEARLQASIEGALRSTEAFGAWPPGDWSVHLHEEAPTFEAATGAPPQRAATWIGDVLHLRPWEQLQRRDLGAVLRHELTHRRLSAAHLRPWEEEARCLWAETHTAPPQPWPEAPGPGLQDRLDLALRRGTTTSQAWAYVALRAWLRGARLPPAPAQSHPADPPWVAEPGSPDQKPLLVRWPENRVPRRVEINGQVYVWGPGVAPHHFEGRVRFGLGPVTHLEGEVDLQATARGWRLRWHTDEAAWVAAASVGELGEDAPLEARRALAAVVRRWLQGHPRQHTDGSLCPLTHCAVLRGSASAETRRAADSAPRLRVPPEWTYFTGSTGGVRLSPRSVWGAGPAEAPPAQPVAEDRWASWHRSLSAAQVAAMKRVVKPGLRPGQKGMMLGASGPYAVEALRIACGRRFGWTLWPSNACEGALRPDGGLDLRGHGWGHNVGLDLALAAAQARDGASAEEILKGAYGAGAID